MPPPQKKEQKQNHIHTHTRNVWKERSNSWPLQRASWLMETYGQSLPIYILSIAPLPPYPQIGDGLT